jgi:hypothetical protein
VKLLLVFICPGASISEESERGRNSLVKFEELDRAAMDM